MPIMIIFGMSKQLFAKTVHVPDKKIINFGLRTCIPNETMFNPSVNFFFVDLCNLRDPAQPGYSTTLFGFYYSETLRV